VEGVSLWPLKYACHRRNDFLLPFHDSGLSVTDDEIADTAVCAGCDGEGCQRGLLGSTSSGRKHKDGDDEMFHDFSSWLNRAGDGVDLDIHFGRSAMRSSCGRVD
jgi:hypothetical protein